MPLQRKKSVRTRFQDATMCCSSVRIFYENMYSSTTTRQDLPIWCLIYKNHDNMYKITNLPLINISKCYKYWYHKHMYMYMFNLSAHANARCNHPGKHHGAKALVPRVDVTYSEYIAIRWPALTFAITMCARTSNNCTNDSIPGSQLVRMPIKKLQETSLVIISTCINYIALIQT